MPGSVYFYGDATIIHDRFGCAAFVTAMVDAVEPLPVAQRYTLERGTAGLFVVGGGGGCPLRR